MKFDFRPPSTFLFLVFHKKVLLQVIHPLKTSRNAEVSPGFAKVLHPREKFGRLPFWNS
jgi:hypothetical protein